MLQFPDGKFRFAVAPNVLNSDTAGYDFFDNEMNGSPTYPKSSDLSKKSSGTESRDTNSSSMGWLFYAHLFDSKYIDQHVYRLFFRNGSIPAYNASSVEIVFPLSSYVLTEMQDYAVKRKIRKNRPPNLRLQLEPRVRL